MAFLLLICLFLSFFLDIFSANFLSTYQPYYLRNALGFSIIETGHFSAIARALNVPFRILFGILSDRITFAFSRMQMFRSLAPLADAFRFISEDRKLVVFNTIAVCGAGLLFLGVFFAPSSTPMLSVVLFALINIALGAGCGGFYKCAVLYSRQVDGLQPRRVNMSANFQPILAFCARRLPIRQVHSAVCVADARSYFRQRRARKRAMETHFLDDRDCAHPRMFTNQSTI